MTEVIPAIQYIATEDRLHIAGGHVAAVVAAGGGAGDAAKR